MPPPFTEPTPEPAPAFERMHAAFLADALPRLSGLSPAWAAVADVEGWAEWLGAMDEARNVFDVTDEATTVITIDVETLAARIAERVVAL